MVFKYGVANQCRPLLKASNNQMASDWMGINLLPFLLTKRANMQQYLRISMEQSKVVKESGGECVLQLLT